MLAEKVHKALRDSGYRETGAESQDLGAQDDNRPVAVCRWDLHAHLGRSGDTKTRAPETKKELRALRGRQNPAGGIHWLWRP